MTLHYYFLPMVSRTEDGQVYREPKYLLAAGVRFALIDYGLIDLAFVAADTTFAQHQSAFDQLDVLSIDPRNGNQRDLDANATQAEIDALVAYLDTAGNFVPMGWATTADTRRAILRGICGIFLFIQTVSTIAGPPTEWGVTLATTWDELELHKQDVMRFAAQQIDPTLADPVGTMTLRQILRFMGSLLSTRPIYLGFAGQL